MMLRCPRPHLLRTQTLLPAKAAFWESCRKVVPPGFSTSF
jgi:hypothetical protein